MPRYSHSAANPNIAAGRPPPARPHTIAIPVTAPPATVAVTVAVTVVTMTVTMTMTLMAMTMTVTMTMTLMTMTVTMTLVAMTVTSERRGRHQQCCSGSGNQEEFANQGIFLQVVFIAYEHKVRLITKSECCEYNWRVRRSPHPDSHLRATRDLAKAAGIHYNTVNRFETECYAGRPETIAAMRKALEQAGVEFTYGKGPRVRLMHPT